MADHACMLEADYLCRRAAQRGEMGGTQWAARLKRASQRVPVHTSCGALSAANSCTCCRAALSGLPRGVVDYICYRGRLMLS